MKLIVAGGTGFTAAEVIKQAVQLDEITSLIVLARKAVPLPGGPGASKVETVIIKDYEEYSDEAKASFTGADACIWTVAITPMKARSLDPVEVQRVCQTCTLAGLQAIWDAKPSNPFRFLYMSADGLPQNTSQRPYFLPDYKLMRVETENLVREFAAKHANDGFELCIAQPGLITAEGMLWQAVRLVNVIPGLSSVAMNITRSQLTAAMLNQIIEGFDKRVLKNVELARIGQTVLKARKKSG